MLNPTINQPCPRCDGDNPPGAVQIGRWKLRDDGGIVHYERGVTLACIHCGHRETMTQIRAIPNPSMA